MPFSLPHQLPKGILENRKKWWKALLRAETGNEIFVSDASWLQWTGKYFMPRFFLLLVNCIMGTANSCSFLPSLALEECTVRPRLHSERRRMNDSCFFFAFLKRKRRSCRNPPPPPPPLGLGLVPSLLSPPFLTTHTSLTGK